MQIHPMRGSANSSKRAASLDDTTAVADLKNAVHAFISVRNWQKFHSPKNLAVALAVEAAELLDLFKWQTDEESIAELQKPAKLKCLSDEVADIVIYCLTIADALALDLSSTVLQKIAKNERKYPVRLNRGRVRAVVGRKRVLKAKSSQTLRRRM